MKQRKCTKCGVSKKASDFNLKNISTGRLHTFCKQCHSEYRKKHYLKNRHKYLLKARKWNKKQTDILRHFMIDYLLENPCIDCGEKDIRVLDFDHEGNKYMGVAQMVRNCYSIAAIKKEIEKCKVRCANCHRIKTFTRGSYWKEKMGA